MTRHVLAVAAWCLAASLAAASAARGGESASPEEIAKLVAQLGSEDFEAREKAEKRLISIGKPAHDAVKAATESQDPETKVRAQRVYDEIRWDMVEAPKDVCALLPVNTVMVATAFDLKKTWERFEKSRAGKAWANQDIQKIWKTVWEAIVEDQGDESRKGFLKDWWRNFGGQWVGALVAIAPQAQLGQHEISANIRPCLGGDRAKVLDMLQKTSYRWQFHENAAVRRHRGVEIRSATTQWSSCQLAAIRDRILQTNSKDLMDGMINSLLDAQKESLATNPGFVQAMKDVGPSPDAAFFWNHKSFMEMVGGGHDGMEKVRFKALGFDALETFAYGASFEGDGVCEKAVARLGGARVGIARLLKLDRTDRRTASRVPPDAVGYLSLKLNGPEIFDAVLALTQGFPEREAKEAKEAFEKLEAKSNLKLPELFAPVKGELGFFVVLPAAGGVIPDLCAVLLAEKPDAAAKSLETFLKAVAKDPAGIKESEHEGGKFAFMSVEEALGEKGSPYNPAWAAQGDALYVASSPAALKNVLKFVASKKPGLQESADFKSVLAAMPPEAEAVLYVDVKRLATFGYSFLPMAAGVIPNEKAKAALNSLPLAEDLFEGVPGLGVALWNDSAGIRAMSRGPVPVASPFLMALFAFSRAF